MNKQSLSRKLRAMGVSDDVIARALNNKPRLPKISQVASAKIRENAAAGEKSVVTYNGKGWNVWTLKNYESRRAAMLRIRINPRDGQTAKRTT